MQTLTCIVTQACNLTLMLILAGTLSSCVLGDGPGLRIAASLVIIRGLLGIAIGGIYSTAIRMYCISYLHNLLPFQ